MASIPEKKTLKKRWWKRGFTCNTQSDPVGRHWATHRHPVDEIVLVSKGKIRVQVGAAWKQPPKGKELVIPRQVPHAIHNDGPIQAHYLYGFRNRPLKRLSK